VIFLTKNIDFLNDIYQNAQMGIIGIDEVLYKVKDDKLKRELEREKKGFNKIITKCTKNLKEYKCKPKKISFMTKMSSEFYSEMKLKSENCDDIILKMMIEGSYKSVGILTTKLMTNDDLSQVSLDLADKLLEMINSNIEHLKKFDKIC